MLNGMDTFLANSCTPFFCSCWNLHGVPAGVACRRAGTIRKIGCLRGEVPPGATITIIHKSNHDLSSLKRSSHIAISTDAYVIKLFLKVLFSLLKGTPQEGKLRK